MSSLIGHGGAGVPISMQGEQKPVVVVDESRFDFILDVVWLAAELGAHVTDLDRLAVFILPLEGDLAGLGLPFPRVRQFEDSGNLPIPRVADGINLAIRIQAIGLGNLFENRRALLRPGHSSKDQYHKTRKTNQLCADMCHGGGSSVN